MSSVLTPRGTFTREVHRLPTLPAYQLNRRYHVKYNVPWSEFDTSDTGYHPQRLVTTSTGATIRTGRNTVSSVTVFKDSTILPYFLNGNFKSYAPELEFLSRQLVPSMPRIPTLYRISDTWVIDDLGRLFHNRKGRYIWYQYNLSGDLRNKLTLTNVDKTSLTRSAYFFSGIAGYSPFIQHKFAFSLEYDFHHVQENKLDLRPDTIVPLEVHLHRYVHSKDLEDAQSSFFRLNKKF